MARAIFSTFFFLFFSPLAQPRATDRGGSGLSVRVGVAGTLECQIHKDVTQRAGARATRCD